MGESKYRVAIIGAGRMGGLLEDESPPNKYRKPHGHFAAYNYIDETDVIAIAGHDENRLDMFTKRFGITNTYLDYQEMIEKEKPDIVSVTTQAWKRADPIIFAAEHGVKGIYAEKALCASLEEADRISNAVKRNNVAFNYGAERRHHAGYISLRKAVASGEIGNPQFALCFWRTDLMKHHSHSFDTISMLLDDPKPTWVEGQLAEPGDPLDPGLSRLGPREGTDMHQRPMPLPTYDPSKNEFVPPEGIDYSEPIMGFSRVGYNNRTEGIFIPRTGKTEFEVHGSEGRAVAWDDGNEFFIRRQNDTVTETRILPAGESPTVSIIREIIREIENNQTTSGNIDVTIQTLEAEFAVAYSHLQGGVRVTVPLNDRSLYIPGH